MPPSIRYNKNLTCRDKLVYCEITATLVDDVCKKKNSYFARVLHSSNATISASITKLREQGFISVIIEHEQNSKKFLNRYIYITPSNFSGGVWDVNSKPYTEISGGVGSKNDNTAGFEGGVPSKKSDSLLYNNNIRYIYTNKDQNNLNPDITDEQLEFLKGIVYNFYTIKRNQFPEIIKSNWNKDKALVNGSINTLYDLIRLDNWDHKVIRDVLKWSCDDKFWNRALLNLRLLRKRSTNNDNTRFQNIYLKYKG